MLFGFNRRKTPVKEFRLPTLGSYATGGQEPSLKEILADPIIHLMARSDKIAPEDLANHFELIRKKR